MKSTNLICVFGSLRKGLWNNHLLAKSNFLGETETEPVFTMLNWGGFPGLLHHGHGKIKIEVYEIESEETWQNLDRLEGYPNFYNRMIIETEFGFAWIYYNPLTDNNKNSDIVESGDWVKFKNE